MDAAAENLSELAGQLARRRTASARRRGLILGVLAALLAVGFVVTLALGQSFTPLGDVWRVLMGENVPGASFTVGRLRLPRAVLSVAAGLSFGMAGAAYQTMLRNSLASPDIIGISASASAAAVVGIVFFSLSGASVATLAVVVSLAVATLIYLLSFKGGVSGTRLILVGIGIAAMLESVIAHTLNQAADWNLQEAMRWLAGSVNGASWGRILPVLIALPVFGGLLLSRSRDLEALRTGDDAAAALGVRVASTRAVVLVAATALVAFATSAAGPVSFVAFLSAPIAARFVGRRGSLLVPAAVTGALLVLVADYIGQFVLPSRYPVGVVTGALGAPFLLYMLVRSQLGGVKQ
ncbi:MAG: iron ABC transporter permease [Trueperaceae bacterium]|nr:iron ABC transporter permease [Trueperaceae bacterium]